MRSQHQRLARVERGLAQRQAVAGAQSKALLTCICRAQLACQPEIAHVTAADTDPETFRHFREILAWARGDYIQAERLKAMACPDEDRVRLVAEERGDPGRALARYMNEGTPTSRRWDLARSAALKTARARMKGAGQAAPLDR